MMLKHHHPIVAVSMMRYSSQIDLFIYCLTLLTD